MFIPNVILYIDRSNQATDLVKDLNAAGFTTTISTGASEPIMECRGCFVSGYTEIRTRLLLGHHPRQS